APQPVVLKFKDDVFLQDRVVTGEQSFARLLLGGKAVVSIGERSAVTITEGPGRSTINVESGKIALSVARERMPPGEVINIKTPNAVAGVRGTAVVAEVIHRSSPGSGVPQPFTRLWVLRGLVEAIHTSPSGAPLSLPVPLKAQESFSADRSTSTKSTFTSGQVATIVQGLQPRRMSDPDRKSTRLNSSHEWISYAVFCWKKKTQTGSSTDVAVLERLAEKPHVPKLILDNRTLVKLEIPAPEHPQQSVETINTRCLASI